MSEVERDSEWERKLAEYAEFNRLDENQRVLKRQIEVGSQTDVASLDKFLNASVEYYHWCARHPEDNAANQQESDAVSYLKYQRISRGSYQNEKANFCLEEAETNKKFAE